MKLYLVTYKTPFYTAKRLIQAKSKSSARKQADGLPDFESGMTLRVNEIGLAKDATQERIIL